MDWGGCPMKFWIWGGMDLDPALWGGLELGLKFWPVKTSTFIPPGPFMNDPVSMFSITYILLDRDQWCDRDYAAHWNTRNPLPSSGRKAGRSHHWSSVWAVRLWSRSGRLGRVDPGYRWGGWPIRITGVHTPEDWAIASARRRTTL